MNEVIKAILERRSIRGFKDDPVSREDLETLVNCAQYSCTGNGLQSWHFAVVTNPDLLNRIVLGCRKVLLQKSADNTSNSVRAAREGRSNLYNAPAVIFISGPLDRTNAFADCCNAAQIICLAAHSLGLGSCYIGSCREFFNTPEGAEIMKELHTPEGYSAVHAVAVGVPAVPPAPRVPRKEGAITFID